MADAPIAIEAPKRIQRKRIKGWRMPPNTVYVGRPGLLGNPFTLADAIEAGFVKATDEAAEANQFLVDCFREWLTDDVSGGRDWWAGTESDARKAAIRSALPRLRGKNLACWCRLDEPCHADVLLEIANDLSALKERLEQASGPDRELDRDLCVALQYVAGKPDAEAIQLDPMPSRADCIMFVLAGCEWSEPPDHLTASIDAALGLVERKLPGWSWDIGATIGGSYSALVWTLDGPSSRETFAPTAPLAILIALVSALIAQEQEG